MQPGKVIHEIALKSKALESMRKNAVRSKLERQMESSAKYFRLRQLFTIWRDNADLKIIYTEDCEISENFRTTILLNQTWSKWKAAQEELILVRKNSKLALKHLRGTLLRRGLYSFMQNVFRISDLHKMEDSAFILHNRNCKESIFHTWKRKFLLSQSLKIMIYESQNFRYTVDLKVSWVTWCRSIIRKKQNQVKIELTVVRYERIHIHKHFNALRVNALLTN